MSAHDLTVKLFLQLAVILVACRVCGWLGRRVGQTQVVSEMVAGVLHAPVPAGETLGATLRALAELADRLDDDAPDADDAGDTAPILKFGS